MRAGQSHGFGAVGSLHRRDAEQPQQFARILQAGGVVVNDQHARNGGPGMFARDGRDWTDGGYGRAR